MDFGGPSSQQNFSLFFFSWRVLQIARRRQCSIRFGCTKETVAADAAVV